MAWSKIPVVATEPPAHQHMDELREAINERDSLLTAMGVYGSSGVPAVTNVANNDYGRYMQQYQKAVAIGLDGNTLIYNLAGPGVDYRCFASTEANDFKTIVKGAPGAGEINFNVETGTTGAGTTWRKLAGLPPTGDPGDIRHPNDTRLVLNRLVRLKTLNNLIIDPFEIYNDGSSTPSGKYSQDTTFDLARAAAFAAIGTYPADIAGIGTPPLLGRNAWNDALLFPPEYGVEANLSVECRCDIDFTDDPGGTTYSGAWLILEAFSASTVGYNSSSEFTFDVYWEGVLVASKTSGDAADITGFKSADGPFGDAWIIDIDPELDIDGVNTCRLVYTDDTTADPGFTQVQEPYSQCVDSGSGNTPSMAVVVEYNHWDYHT